MDYYFITGTGSGLGKAFAEELLQGNKVTGISRHQSIHHTNFSFIETDLSKAEEVKNFQFDIPENADSVYLINNAAMIDPVYRCGDLPDEDIIQAVQLNLSSLMILCNKFIAQAKKRSGRFIIINISSGAAANPVPSWSVYCSTKAAVDMFTRVITAELRELKISNIHAFSVYPGIIDTPMQEEIRSKNEKDFSSKSRFVDYKKSGELQPADLTARKILGIFKGKNLPEEPVFSIRDK